MIKVTNNSIEMGGDIPTMCLELEIAMKSLSDIITDAICEYAADEFIKMIFKHYKMTDEEIVEESVEILERLKEIINE